MSTGAAPPLLDALRALHRLRTAGDLDEAGFSATRLQLLERRRSDRRQGGSSPDGVEPTDASPEWS